MNVTLVKIDKSDNSLSIFKDMKDKFDIELDRFQKIGKEIEEIKISENDEFRNIKKFIINNILTFFRNIILVNHFKDVIQLPIYNAFSEFPNLSELSDDELLEDINILTITYLLVSISLNKINLFKDSIINSSIITSFSLENENEILSYIDDKIIKEKIESEDINIIYNEIDDLVNKSSGNN